MQNQNLDVMQLGRYVTKESEGGRITQQLLVDGKFVVTHVISDSVGYRYARAASIGLNN